MFTSFQNNPNALTANQSVVSGASPTFASPIITGTPIVSRYKSISVPATSMVAGATPPVLTKFRDNGAGSNGVFSWAFDDAKAQETYFSVQLPSSYKEATVITPIVRVATIAAQTVTNITFNLEYTIATAGTLNAITASIQGVVATPVALTPTYAPLLPVIAAAGRKVHDIIMCRLSRPAIGFVGNVYVLSVDFLINVDTIGSATTLAK